MFIFTVPFGMCTLLRIWFCFFPKWENTAETNRYVFCSFDLYLFSQNVPRPIVEVLKKTNSTKLASSIECFSYVHILFCSCVSTIFQTGGTPNWQNSSSASLTLFWQNSTSANFEFCQFDPKKAELEHVTVGKKTSSAKIQKSN